MTGSVVILTVPFATIRIGELVVSLSTPGGSAAVLVGAVLACCAATLWSRPEFRVPVGVVTMIAALVAVATTNLGGLIIGSVLGVVGAAAALAWTPRHEPDGT